MNINNYYICVYEKWGQCFVIEHQTHFIIKNIYRYTSIIGKQTSLVLTFLTYVLGDS